MKRVSKDLILNKAISINDHLFSIIDVEVYYWHVFHQDYYTKGIFHTRTRGEFELHRFGIDLSLGEQGSEGFGGILICGLYDLSKQRTVPKPEVIKAIFNQMHIGNNTFNLIDKQMPWKEVFSAKRQNLGEPGNDPNKIYFKDAMYKFVALHSDLFFDFHGKEKLIRDSDLTETQKYSLLNYVLKK